MLRSHFAPCIYVYTCWGCMASAAHLISSCLSPYAHRCLRPSPGCECQWRGRDAAGEQPLAAEAVSCRVAIDPVRLLLVQ